MDTSAVISLVKARLGITGTVRDMYLTAIIEGVLKELENEKGLALDGANPYHLMFVVDYVTWRYQSRDSDTGMPRHLQFRLHNLMIHVGSQNLRVDSVVTVDVLPAIPAPYTVYILPDSSKQIYIDGAWTPVEFADGWWRVVVL